MARNTVTGSKQGPWDESPTAVATGLRALLGPGSASCIDTAPPDQIQITVTSTMLSTPNVICLRGGSGGASGESRALPRGRVGRAPREPSGLPRAAG